MSMWEADCWFCIQYIKHNECIRLALNLSKPCLEYFSVICIHAACNKQKESIHSCLYFLFVSTVLQNFNIFCSGHHISLCFRIPNYFHLSRANQNNTICRFCKVNISDLILPRFQQKPGRFLLSFSASCLKGCWETWLSKFCSSSYEVRPDSLGC